VYPETKAQKTAQNKIQRQSNAQYTRMRFLILLSIVGMLALALGGSEERRDKDIVEREVEVEERATSNCGTVR
jgi:hypothetical protein